MWQATEGLKSVFTFCDNNAGREKRNAQAQRWRFGLERLPKLPYITKLHFIVPTTSLIIIIP